MRYAREKKPEIIVFLGDQVETIDFIDNIEYRMMFERIISEFEENVESLQNHPKSGRTVPELERQGITKYRELIQEYYRIVYEISGNTIIVHTIIDGRRNFEEIIISKLSRYYGNKT